MDSTLRPVLKRQVLFMGASLAVGLVVSYFFGFLIGLAANIAVLVAIMFYMRRRQLRAMKAFGFGDETAGGGFASRGVSLRYVCLSCGGEFKGASCGNCGSRMKKPLF
jgi:hypothetical protein